MTSSRERVKKALRFEEIDRLPYDLPAELGFSSDFYMACMADFPEERPRVGKDAWGSSWHNIGDTVMGEVVEYPLDDWSKLSDFNFPDVAGQNHWAPLKDIRQVAGDKYLMGFGFPIYDRLHFLRGMENTWTDIYLEQENLEFVIDKIVDMNIQAIEQYAKLGFDGFYTCDDWGLQDRLVIAPEKWREIWKPRYAKMWQRVHECGMDAFLHSCGEITAVLGDMIEIGCDSIQMDQQMNMGIERLGKIFGGRINFFSPADIQTVMSRPHNEIRSYCREMKKHLAPGGIGLIPKYYYDWKPIQTREALQTMCEEFEKM